MAHSHASGGAKHRGRLALVFGLTTTYMVAEFIGALITNSLALLADAAHMLTDVAGLALALFAIWFGARPASPAKSFGYFRVEILAALLNGTVLLGIGVYILYEAWSRFREPPEVSGGSMIVVASIGLVINLVGMALLRGGSQESLNVQGAFLEVVADMLGSVGVIAAGLVIWTTGWWYADPIFSVGIGLFVIPRTLRLMSKAVDVLLEGAPEGMDIPGVEAALRSVPGVTDVHELHVWSITSGIASLSAHVRVAPETDSDGLLDSIERRMADRFDIHHTTVQIERSPRAEASYHASAVPPAPEPDG